ncbi:hypothetical protein D3C72_912030 [compost metagenome]
MSMRKPSAPRLLPSASKVAISSTGERLTCSICSTSSRMRCTVCAACSSPSTENTPRICMSWVGTVRSNGFSAGRRKYWSSDFSSSLRWLRSSSTTVPMVWRSLTRRYRSSIHGSSGSERPPSRTRSMRPASCSVRAVSCGSLGSRSSSAASRYSTEVATSIASSVSGGWPERTEASTACVSACTIGWLGGCSFSSDSPSCAKVSATCRVRVMSPPESADHISLAVSMRLRACESTSGSKRPNCTTV